MEPNEPAPLELQSDEDGRNVPIEIEELSDDDLQARVEAVQLMLESLADSLGRTTA